MNESDSSDVESQNGSDDENIDFKMSEGRAKLLEKSKNVSLPNDLTKAEKRIQYLMAQSEIFSHFLSEDQSDSNGVVMKGSGSKRNRLAEATEDKNLLRAAQVGAANTRLSSQPLGIVGGKMRSYQLEGLNWMIKLHENCVNGILADEMGLGMKFLGV